MPGFVSARFNSTSSTTSTVSTTATGENVTDAVSEAATSSLPDFNAADIAVIPEKIGYLKELGLDYGWGPTSLIEFVMEHLHVYTGLPWWASIIATGLLVRLALLKPLFMATDTSTKMRNVQYLTKPLRTKMQANLRTNQFEVQKAQAEISQINKERGIVVWHTFIPMIQVPLGFGCYRLVEGMSHLPVPGLAAESVAWLTDLTVADPFFILPLASAGLVYLNLRKTAEMNSSDMFNSSLGKTLRVALPTISLIFMSFFPAALQLYFATTGLFALGQTHLLSSKRFRMYMNIEIPDPVVPDSVNETSQKIRTMREQILAEQAKLLEAQKKDTSIIDRAVNSIKETGKNIKQDTQEKISELTGATAKKDEIPSRLSKKDLDLARNYENRRRQEEEWKREERNHARREAYLKTSAAQKQKIAREWVDAQRAKESKQ